MIYMSRWDNREGGRGELKSRGSKEDKVVIEFKDKDQFRKFSSGGKENFLKED